MLVEGIGVNSSDKSLGNSVSLLRPRDGSLALTRNDFALSHEDTIGRIPIGVLWIFFRKYNLAGRTFLGGEQKATMFLFRS